jgi:hypothetical protein
MATLISNASGNLTGAATFALTETGAGATTLIRSGTGWSFGVGSQTSSTFTVTNASVIDGVLLWVRQGSFISGTLKVDLQKGGVSQASVTVNVVDLPPNNTSPNASVCPVFFKFTGTATGDGGANWTLVLTLTGSGVVEYQCANATIANMTRALRTTTAATAAAGDNLIITGEHTSAGTKNIITVTMDSTVATVYGSGVLNSVSVAGSGIYICNWGTLTYGTTAYIITPVTLDPAVTNVTLSNGNLTATGTSGSNGFGARVADASAKTTGKYYFEATTGQHFSSWVGVAVAGTSYISLQGSVAANGAFTTIWDGTMLVNGSNMGAIGGGSPYGVAVDLDNRKIWFRIAPSGNWNNSGTANPATNTGGWTLMAGSIVPYFPMASIGDVITANFGATAFSGTVPSGFTAGWANSVPTAVAPAAGANYILRVAGDVIVYVNGTLNMGSSAAGTITVSTEAAAFLARTSGLDGTHIVAYATLIDGLVADGIWTKLDMLHIYATQDSTTARLNLISTSYPATPAGTPVFVADRGYTGTHASGSDNLSTGFNAATASSPKFVQDSAHVSVWVVTSSTGVGLAPIGGILLAGAKGVYIYPKDGDLLCSYYINTTTGTLTPFANANTRGFYTANRSGASATQLYKDGSSIHTGTPASVTVANVEIKVCANNSDGGATSSGLQIACASIGSSLTSGEVTAFYNRLRTYMTAVGVP